MKFLSSEIVFSYLRKSRFARDLRSLMSDEDQVQDACVEIRSYFKVFYLLVGEDPVYSTWPAVKVLELAMRLGGEKSRVPEPLSLLLRSDHPQSPKASQSGQGHGD